MATATATSIELGATSAIDAPSAAVLRTRVPATDPSSGSGEDEVLVASRLADSTVPDGGYGWVMITGCSVMTWWFVGTTYSWGVIQGRLVDKGVSSPATLSYIGSIAIASISFMAILNARIMRAIGAQRTGMLGIALLGLAELLSSFAVDSGSVAGLFLTSGILLGIGTSLCFMTVSSTPAQYFSRKRGLANGIVFAGGGLGGAVTSYTMEALMSKVGAPWAYRALAAITLLTGLPAAWLVKERVPARPAGFIEW